MKKPFFTIISAFVFIGAFSATPSFAQAPADHTQHDGHAPDATASPSADPKAMGAKHDMGKMNMEHMQGMMKECMDTKKDDKMCDHDMMKMCHSKMGKSECKKMMKRAKTQNGTMKK